MTNPQPRHCPACHGIFLPGVESDAAPLICPHCASAMRLRDCPPAVVAGSVDQDDTMVPEREMKAARMEKVRQSQQRLLLSGLGIAGVLVLAAWAWQRFVARPPVEQPVPAEASDTAIRPELLAVATRALAAGSPEAQRAFVVDPDRVGPVMEWMHTRQPDVFRAVTVKSCRSSREKEIAGRTMALLQLEIDGEADRWVWLEQQPGGWKLDWESYVNPGHLQWKEFLRSDPGTELECRVLLSRHHTTPTWLSSAGQPDQPALTLRAEMRPGAPVAIASAPENATLWEEMGPLPWGSFLNCIARVKIISRQCDPPLVEISQIIQHGWLYGSDLRKFRDASLVLPPEAVK